LPVGVAAVAPTEATAVLVVAVQVVIAPALWEILLAAAHQQKPHIQYLPVHYIQSPLVPGALEVWLQVMQSMAQTLCLVMPLMLLHQPVVDGEVQTLKLGQVAALVAVAVLVHPVHTQVVRVLQARVMLVVLGA
jgi:hypothetical protein